MQTFIGAAGRWRKTGSGRIIKFTTILEYVGRYVFYYRHWYNVVYLNRKVVLPPAVEAVAVAIFHLNKTRSTS